MHFQYTSRIKQGVANILISFIQRAHIYSDPRLIGLLVLGFVSGLPFLLTLSTLSRWLAETGVSNTKIGLFMLVSSPYSCKFLWAPVIDNFPMPFFTRRFGHRRGWFLVTQICLLISLLLMSQSDPKNSLIPMALSALLVAFFSATQDIIVDAYRIDILTPALTGAGAAAESIGFKFGMLASGTCALYFASIFSWAISYQIMAATVGIGMVTVLFMAEPEEQAVSKKAVFLSPSLYWRPAVDVLRHNNIIYLLLFILFFKFGDVVLQAMSAPFLYELGVSKIEFATLTKVYGIGLMVFGGLFAGILVNFIGMLNSIRAATILQAISCLMFVLQARVGYDPTLLSLTMCLEGFCSGVVTSVFIAYLSSICLRRFSASQFTLLYSFGSLCRVVLSVASGWLADYLGFVGLFALCAIATMPVLICLSQLRVQSQNEVIMQQ